MASPSRVPSVRRPSGAPTASGKIRPMSMFEVSADHLKNLRHLGESASNLLHDVKSSASDATSKQSKRRSLLPQFSRKGSDVKELPAAIREDESESADGSISEDTNDSRRAMPPPPKPVKQGIKPPGSGLPSASTAHSRTRSKETNGLNGRITPVNSTAAPAAKRTVPTKMPHVPTARTSSLQGKPSHTRAASSVSAFGAHTRAASTISTHGTPSAIGEKRGSISVARPLTSGSMASMSGPNQTSPPRPMSRSNAKSQLAAPSRPAFSTYQQHYSPAKSVLPKPGIPSNGKPSTTQPAAAATGPAEPEEEEIPMTFDIAREQIDLLQLSLLHQSSAATLRAYEYSAKHKLSHRHAKLQQDFQAIETRERTQRKQINLEALESWCGVDMRDSILLAEHLQVLNRAVADLRELTEPGSRFLDMTTTFEDWTMKAESVLLGDGKAGGNGGAYIEALPQSWSTAHTSLAIKLRSVQHDLRALPPAPQEADLEDPSSLKLLLETCFRLVDGMLRELDVMMKVQKEVMSRGKAQVDDQVKTILQPGNNQNSSLLEKQTWTPAWRKQADGAVAGA